MNESYGPNGTRSYRLMQALMTIPGDDLKAERRADLLACKHLMQALIPAIEQEIERRYAVVDADIAERSLG